MRPKTLKLNCTKHVWKVKKKSMTWTCSLQELTIQRTAFCTSCGFFNQLNYVWLPSLLLAFALRGYLCKPNENESHSNDPMNTDSGLPWYSLRLLSNNEYSTDTVRIIDHFQFQFTDIRYLGQDGKALATTPSTRYQVLDSCMDCTSTTVMLRI